MKQLLVIVVVAGVIGYLLGTYASNSKFDRNLECQEAGERLYQDDKSQAQSQTLFTPRYAYNKKLGTCLYAGGKVTTSSVELWIKNSLSGQTVVEYAHFPNLENDDPAETLKCEECVSSRDEFDQVSAELMGAK